MSVITLESPIKILKNKDIPLNTDLQNGNIALYHKDNKSKIFGNIDDVIYEFSGVGKFKSNGEIFNDYINNLSDGENSHNEGSGDVKYFQNLFNEESPNIIILSQVSIEVLEFTLDYFTGIPENIKTICTPIKLYNINYDSISVTDFKNNLITNVYKQIKFNNKTYNFICIDTNYEIDGNIILLVVTNEDTLSNIEGIQVEFNILHNSIGISSHNEGLHNVTISLSGHTEGSCNVNMGDISHVEGLSNISLSNYSHVEGSNCKVCNDYGHSEGYGSIVLGNAGHSEGENTTAKGNNSHSENLGTYAKGNSSHTSGINTIANNLAEFTVGQYNKSNYGDSITDSNESWKGDNKTTLFTIGNGTSDTNRKNAFEVYQDGSIMIQKPGTDTMINLSDKIQETINIKVVNKVL